MKSLRFAALSFLIVACAAAIDVPLRFQSYADGNSYLLPFSEAHVVCTQQPPAGDWKLPQIKSKTPAYALLKLGDAEFLAILDANSPSDSFYKRIYFDANHNRDLTDDPEVNVDTSYSWWLGYAQIRAVSAFTITLSENGQNVPYAFSLNAFCEFSGFSLNLSRKEDWARLSIAIMPCCMLTGEFDFGGEHYRFSMCDQDANGRFGEVASPVENQDGDSFAAKGDTIYLATKSHVDFGDALGMGDKLFLKDTLFDVSIDRASSKMTLTPVTQATGTLALPQGMQRLVLSRTDGKSTVALLEPGTVVPVPPGDYRVYSYRLQREDQAGQIWRIDGAGVADGTVTKVSEGAQSSLIACEPLQPKVKLAYYEKPGLLSWSGSATLGFFLKGAGGERIGSVLCGGKGPFSEAKPPNWSNPSKPPTYKVMTDDGQIVAQGQFEYG